jgi:peptidoglycan/xylan/chitin deacetylase (PgdA/CDA1 family)
MPSRFTLPRDERLAVSLVVNVEEGAEQNVGEGDKLPEPVDELAVALKTPIRNFANESNYLYGIRAGAPRVLRLLAERGFTATFTAAAVALEKAPQLARAIADAGHEVCSYGYRWVHQFSYSEEREREFIQKATESLRQSVGARPYGLALALSLYTQHPPAAGREGYLYHMDDFGDDVPRWEAVGRAGRSVT